jgi:hypothetical protein
MDAGRFWRVAKGKEYFIFPTAPRQLLLFDEVPASDILEQKQFRQTQGEPRWSRTALEDMGILYPIE